MRRDKDLGRLLDEMRGARARGRVHQRTTGPRKGPIPAAAPKNSSTRNPRAPLAKPSKRTSRARDTANSSTRMSAETRALISQIVAHALEQTIGKDGTPGKGKPNTAARRRKLAKITETMLLRAKHKTTHAARPPTTSPFAIPQFPPGAAPPKGSGLAMDDNTSITSTLNWATQAQIGALFHEGLIFLGYPMLSQLLQRAEYRRMVETIATEMTRKWIRLTGKGDDDKTEKIKIIQSDMDRYDVRGKFREAAGGDASFGRSHLFLDVGDNDDRDELLKGIGDGREALSKLKVNRDRPLKAIRAVEATWCYATSYNASDPTAPDWYQPQRWFIMGKEVDASRLLTFIGRPVPDMLKPAYAFGGLALTQMAKPYVDNWLRTRQSVSDIIHAFSIMVLLTEMGEDMGVDGDELFKRLDLFNATRDNRGIMAIDKSSEDFKNVSAPLGTLDALQAQSQEHMSSVSAIPLVKLLGITPKGLNASSEGELREFYDWIAAYQEMLFRKNLDKVLAFIQLSRFGEVDPDIIYVFEPLWSLDAKGEAEVQKIKAETGAVLVDGGIVSQEEERKRVATDPNTPYAGLDVNDVPEMPEQGEGEGGEGSGGEGEGGGGSDPGEGEGFGKDDLPVAITTASSGAPAGKRKRTPGAADDRIVPFVGALLKAAARADQLGYLRGCKGCEVEPDRDQWNAAYYADRDVIGLQAKFADKRPLDGMQTLLHEIGHRGRQVDPRTYRAFERAGLGDMDRFEQICNPTHMRDLRATDQVEDVTGEVFAESYARAMLGLELPKELRAFWDNRIASAEQAADAWTESDHPRGQPGNAGQFGSGGGGGSTKEKQKLVAPQYGMPHGHFTAGSSSSSKLSDLFGSSFAPSRPKTTNIGGELDPAKLKKVGKQMGSNPGGVYEDADGKRFYVKQGKSIDHVRNEMIAASLYDLAGTPTLNYRTTPGGTHVATEMEKLDKDNAHKMTDKERREAQKDFAVHAWLANWDAIGLGGDNLGTVKGVPTVLDAGGALEYRAQGAPKGKAFGDKVGELSTLRDGTNKDASAIFGDMTPSAMRESARFVTSISDSQIRKAVEGQGGDDGLADKLIARKKDIARQAALFGAEGDPKKATSTMVVPAGSEMPIAALNGVEFKAWKPRGDWKAVEGQGDFDEPAFDVPKGKRAASGVIIREKDGRIWMIQPRRGYGGYEGSFPKGGIDDGLDPRSNAIKECWEESGLKVRLTGHAGDAEGDSGVTRFYYGEREGGDPSQHDDETEGVVLAPASKADGFLNRTRDRDMLKKATGAMDAALAIDEAKFEEGKHPRGPDGKFTSGTGGGGGIAIGNGKFTNTDVGDILDYIAKSFADDPEKKKAMVQSLAEQSGVPFGDLAQAMMHKEEGSAAATEFAEGGSEPGTMEDVEAGVSKIDKAGGPPLETAKKKIGVFADAHIGSDDMLELIEGYLTHEETDALTGAYGNVEAAIEATIAAGGAWKPDLSLKSTNPALAAATPKAGEFDPSKYKSKKDLVGALLEKGTNPAEVMKHTGWPSVSMPQQAKAAGMKLVKSKDANGNVVYKGEKMTPEEIKAAATETKQKQQAAAAGAAFKAAESPTATQYTVKAINDVPPSKLQPAEKAMVAKLEAQAAAINKAPAPKFPPPTAAEMEKAKKNIPLQPQYLPGYNDLQFEAAKKSANTLLQAFNAQYAGKNLTTPSELAAKVNSFKAMGAMVANLKAGEQANLSALQKQQAEKAAATAAAQKQQEQAAAKAAAAENAKYMETLGINQDEADGFGALVKMMGGNSAAFVENFKHYGSTAQSYGYPISGFQCALIKNYTNGGYGAINAALRKGSVKEAQHVYTKMVNKALLKMPKHTGVVKRGTDLDASVQEIYKPGHVVEERAFTSSSTSHPWHGNTQYTITAKGQRGVHIKKLSNHPSEDEVLFAARTLFKVTKVEGSPGGQMHVHMEEMENVD